MSKRLAILFIGFIALAVTAFAVRHLNPHGHGNVPKEIEDMRQCQINLRQMQLAKVQWAASEHKGTNDVPSWEELVGKDKYLICRFQCRAGGTYTWGRVCDLSTCSLPGHTLK